MMAKVSRMAAYLDRRLRIADFRDESHNGLQVENSGTADHICAGVDASQAFFEAAAARGGRLLVCHHGLSWGDSLSRVTGLNYRRLKFLLDRDIALYACHLPLDAHPQLGNNAQLFRALGLRNRKPFGAYHGMTIGFRGEWPRAVPYAEFEERVRRVVGGPVRVMAFGKKIVRTAAIVSGGGGDLLAQAGEQGLDVYLSGEPQLLCWHLARELRINAVFAGHYATETFGVKALARLLAARFGVAAEFLDLKVPF